MARGAPADARSDLYSLGATVFHILIGRPPFQGASVTELLVKRQEAEPPSVAAARPRVDPRFCAIIDALLSKRPEDRPASAQAVLDDLEALGPLQPATRPAHAGDPAVRPAPPAGYTLEQIRKGWAGLAWAPEYHRAMAESARRQDRRDLARNLWLISSAAGLMLLGMLIALVLDHPAGLFAWLLVPAGILRLIAAAIPPGGISGNRWYVRRALYRHPFLKFLAFSALAAALLSPGWLWREEKRSEWPKEQAAASAEEGADGPRSAFPEMEEMASDLWLLVTLIVAAVVVFLVSCEPGSVERR